MIDNFAITGTSKPSVCAENSPDKVPSHPIGTSQNAMKNVRPKTAYARPIRITASVE